MLCVSQRGHSCVGNIRNTIMFKSKKPVFNGVWRKESVGSTVHVRETEILETQIDQPIPIIIVMIIIIIIIIRLCGCPG